MKLVSLIMSFGVIVTVVTLAVAQAPRENYSVPVGFIMASAGDKHAISNPNEVWLLCDGSSLLIKDHLALFSVIGWTYGLGKDAKNRTTFALPDYRGFFLRGVAEGSSRDPDRDLRVEPFDLSIPAGDRVGTVQLDALQSHKHVDAGHSHESNAVQGGWEWSDNTEDRKVGRPNPPGATVQDGFAKLGDPVDSETGAGPVRHGKETRPANVAVYWYIKSR